jgi:hypothetical protein
VNDKFDNFEIKPEKNSNLETNLTALMSFANDVDSEFIKFNIVYIQIKEYNKLV